MENNRLSILIVGGTGVISYGVALEAIRKGINVTCINRGKSHLQRLPQEIEVITADYHNRSLMESKLKGRYFDAVLDVLCFRKEDIEYSVSLFKDKCNQYMFFSSCAVYNKGKGDYECTEDSPQINPVWNYSINKVGCENALRGIAAKYNLNYTIVRPAVTYGNTRIPYGISPKYGYHGTLIHRILNHKPIILWDYGEAYSTITRVEDFANGFVALIGNPKAYNEVFNIVGDERHKWKEVSDMLGQILGVEPIYFNVSKEVLAKEMPLRSGEILGGRGITQMINNSKIKSVVKDFKTNISLKEGMQMTVNYYKTNGYLYGIDYSFDGDWDRIINKYAKAHHYNIGFIDYLGNATFSDKMKYIMEKKKHQIHIRALRSLVRCTRKVNKLYSKFKQTKTAKEKSIRNKYVIR